MRRTDPYSEIQAILDRSAATDAGAARRMARIWNAICKADYSSEVHPIEHFLSVVNMLESRGITMLTDKSRKRILTVRNRPARVGSTGGGRQTQHARQED